MGCFVLFPTKVTDNSNTNSNMTNGIDTSLNSITDSLRSFGLSEPEVPLPVCVSPPVLFLYPFQFSHSRFRPSLKTQFKKKSNLYIIYYNFI